jgi:hypothetical protein
MYSTRNEEYKHTNQYLKAEHGDSDNGERHDSFILRELSFDSSQP